MYGYAYHGVTTCTFASNAKVCTAFDAREANRIAVEMGAFGTLLATTTANLFVQGAINSGTTFRRIKAVGVYSAVSGLEDWEVPSTTGDFIAVCDPALGFEAVRFELSNTATDGAECYVHTFK